MRIRQVKPAFWSDPTIADVSYPARLFYIGLWCVADDAGYIEWRPAEIGALLFPYETPKARMKHMATWTTELYEAGRIIVSDCGCVIIPTLPKHQRISGKQSFHNRDRHQNAHHMLTGKQSSLTDRPGSGSGRERNGSGTREISNEETTTGDFKSRMVASGLTALGKPA